MHAEQARTMAAYNRWMNDKLYAVCAELSDEERKGDRGAFFGSIHGTLNHLLLADKVWMGRLSSMAPFKPTSLDQELHSDFTELRAARSAMDSEIEAWATELTDETLSGTIEYMTIMSPEPQRNAMWVCLTHLFNHQTHHRGQLTTLLSQMGKDYGVTDLMRLPGVTSMAR